MKLNLITCLLTTLIISTFQANADLLKSNNFFVQFSQAKDIQSGDINGDSLSDLLIVTGHQEGALIYLNNGENQFYFSKHQFSSGMVKNALLGDFDDDGDLDIKTTSELNESEDVDSLFINNGQGVFERTDTQVFNNPNSNSMVTLLSGDLDNDGDQDIIRVLQTNEYELLNAYVLINNGAASFQLNELNIEDLRITALADFNNDGFLDVWSMGGRFKIYLNDGNGMFDNDANNEIDISFGGTDIEELNPVLADIDNDGDVDIQTFSTQYYLPRHINNGDGTFSTPGVAVYLSSPGIQVGAFLDADGDQDLDLWYAHDSNNNSQVAITNDQGEIDLNVSTINIEENQIEALVTDDFDNDGDLDVVTVGVNGINIWESESSENFVLSEQTVINENWGIVQSVTLADMNGDGNSDLVTVGKDGVKVAHGNGRSSFASLQQQYDTLVFRSHTTDLNDDGYADVAIIKPNGELDVLMNDQSGGFNVQEISIDAPNAYKINAGDIDGDGDVDLVVQEYFGSIFVLANQDSHEFNQIQVIQGGFRVAELVDLNRDGNLSLVAQNVFNFLGETTAGVIEYEFSEGRFNKSRFVAIENMFQKNLVFLDYDDDNDLDILTNKSLGGGQFVLIINNDTEFESSGLTFPFGFPSKAEDMDNDGLVDLINDSGDVFLKTSSGYEPIGESDDLYSTDPFVLGDLDQDSDLDMIVYESEFGISTLINTTIDQDFSGLWYDPTQNGHGIQVEEILANGSVQVHVSWYVYHNGEQLWLTGLGPIVNNVANVGLYITSGPDFGSDYVASDLNIELWGTAVLTMNQQNQLNYAWDGSSSGFSSGEMEMTLLADIKATSKTIQKLNSCHSGSWYSPSEDGHGYMVQMVNIGGQENMVMTWYTYLAGEQYWLTAVGGIDGFEANLSVQATTGGLFPPDFEASDINFIDWGSIKFTLQDENHAKISWAPTLDGLTAGELEVQRLTLIDRYQCH